jgi:hypothetical protein
VIQSEYTANAFHIFGVVSTETKRIFHRPRVARFIDDDVAGANVCIARLSDWIKHDG